MKRALVALALVVGCSRAEQAAPDPASTHALSSLSKSERQALCERIVKKRRASCDPSFADIDAQLVRECVADQPLWRCNTITAGEYEKCAGGKEACPQMEQHANACKLRDELRKACPLFVATVKEGGAASTAGLRAGDRIRALDGSAIGAADAADFTKRVETGAKVHLTVVRADGESELDVTPQKDGETFRIGVSFDPPPECAAFMPKARTLPCSVK